MKKKVAIGILSVLMVVGGTTAAFGAGTTALDPAKLAEIKTLTQQMFGIQKQIVDKEVEAGAITQDQADKMKKGLDQRLEQREKAITDGKLFGMERGKANEKRGDMKFGIKKPFNNGQPLTEDQIKTWLEKAEARLTAQEAAMKKYGKLTEAQIKTWIDAERAQLNVQAEAMKSGTFIPGGMGMPGPGGKGMPGKGMHGAVPGQTTAPASSSAPGSATTTN